MSRASIFLLFYLDLFVLAATIVYGLCTVNVGWLCHVKHFSYIYYHNYCSIHRSVRALLREVAGVLPPGPVPLHPPGKLHPWSRAVHDTSIRLSGAVGGAAELGGGAEERTCQRAPHSPR